MADEYTANIRPGDILIGRLPPEETPFVPQRKPKTGYMHQRPMVLLKPSEADNRAGWLVLTVAHATRRNPGENEIRESYVDITPFRNPATLRGINGARQFADAEKIFQVHARPEFVNCRIDREGRVVFHVIDNIGTKGVEAILQKQRELEHPTKIEPIWYYHLFDRLLPRFRKIRPIEPPGTN